MEGHLGSHGLEVRDAVVEHHLLLLQRLQLLLQEVRFFSSDRKVHIRLHEKGNSNSHDARPVHSDIRHLLLLLQRLQLLMKKVWFVSFCNPQVNIHRPYGGQYRRDVGGSLRFKVQLLLQEVWCFSSWCSRFGSSGENSKKRTSSENSEKVEDWSRSNLVKSLKKRLSRRVVRGERSQEEK